MKELELTYCSSHAKLDELIECLSSVFRIEHMLKKDIRIEIMTLPLFDHKEKIVYYDNTLKYIVKNRIYNDTYCCFKQKSKNKKIERIIRGFSSNCIYIKERVKVKAQYNQIDCNLIISKIIPIVNQTTLDIDNMKIYFECECHSQSDISNISNDTNLDSVLRGCNITLATISDSKINIAKRNTVFFSFSAVDELKIYCQKNISNYIKICK